MYIALLDRVLFSLVLVCNQLLSNNNIYRFVVKRIDATVGGGGGSVDSGAEQCSKYHNSVNIMTLYITVTAQTHKHLEENVNEE